MGSTGLGYTIPRRALLNNNNNNNTKLLAIYIINIFFRLQSMGVLTVHFDRHAGTDGGGQVAV